MRDVLVVEDDRVVLAAVARLCGSDGLSVDEADGVDRALARLAEGPYRLVLVDLMLPGRSGFELLEVLRAEPPATPVVMISGYATSENSLKSLRLGAFDFLPKPFDVVELLGVVRRALRYGERHSGGVVDAVAPAAEPRYFLGRHSWAVMDADGVATIGTAETFQGVLGDEVRIELPAAGGHVVQGCELARLEGSEEAHRIWSPLSGLVVAVNSELTRTADSIDRSSLGSGWLVRIVPADLENERMALTLRPAEETHQSGG